VNSIESMGYRLYLAKERDFVIENKADALCTRGVSKDCGTKSNVEINMISLSFSSNRHSYFSGSNLVPYYLQISQNGNQHLCFSASVLYW